MIVLILQPSRRIGRLTSTCSFSCYTSLKLKWKMGLRSDNSAGDDSTPPWWKPLFFKILHFWFLRNFWCRMNRGTTPSSHWTNERKALSPNSSDIGNFSRVRNDDIWNDKRGVTRRPAINSPMAQKLLCPLPSALCSAHWANFGQQMDIFWWVKFCFTNLPNL